MALEIVGYIMGREEKKRTRESYELDKRRALSKPLLPTEYMRDGTIRCKKCEMDKIFDDPAHFMFFKCCCRCEQQAWERQFKDFAMPKKMRVAQLGAGDFNPFDKK